MKGTFIRSSIVVASLCVFSTSYAGSANSNLAVSATVNSNCSITTTPLAFGTYDPVGANATAALNGTGSVSVACTKGATGLSVGMNNGGNFASGSRNMSAGGGNTLSYGLYQPPSNTPSAACTFPGTTAWGTTIGTNTLALTNAPSSAARSYNVCGTIPAGQDVAAGSYTDTVVATINF